MTPVRVLDIMTRYVEFLDPDATIQDAAIMMGDLDVGCLPLGTETAVEGVITDRDILYRVVAAGLEASTKVRRVMSEPVITCAETDTVQAALDTMAAHHIRRLPALGDSGTVTGWITLADLSRKLLVEDGTLQQSLKALTEAQPK